jgi:putative transposase
MDLLVLRGRTDRSKDVEILVLRHQLAVLQRQHPHLRFEPEGRAILTALARAFSRDRWSIFLVKPDTILRWHRRLVANRWTYSHRPGRPATTVETRRAIMRLARENPTWDTDVKPRCTFGRVTALRDRRSASGASRA